VRNSKHTVLLRAGGNYGTRYLILFSSRTTNNNNYGTTVARAYEEHKHEKGMDIVVQKVWEILFGRRHGIFCGGGDDRRWQRSLYIIIELNNGRARRTGFRTKTRARTQHTATRTYITYEQHTSYTCTEYKRVID